MSLMDQNDSSSSSFCSLDAGASVSVSQTTDQNPNNMQHFPESPVAVSARNMFLNPTTTMNKATEEDKGQQSMNLSSIDRTCSHGPTLHHVHGGPLQEKALEGGDNAVDSFIKKDVGEKPINLKCDDNDNASSIEFVVDDTIPEGSQLSTSSSILFIRDPSEATSREAGALSRAADSDVFAAKNIQQKNLGPLSSSKPKKADVNGTREGARRGDGVQEIGPWCAEHRTKRLQGRAPSAVSEKGRRVGRDSPRRNTQERGRPLHSEGVKSRPRSSDRESWGSSGSKYGGRRGSPCSRDSSTSRAHLHSFATNKTLENKRRTSSATPPRSCNSRQGSLSDRGLLHSRNLVTSSPRRRNSSSTLQTGSVDASLRHQCVTPLRNMAHISPALRKYKQYSLLDLPPSRRREERENLLTLLDDEMDLVRTEVKERDMAMELTMLQSPFERLYHMNNRRDRDERRCRIFHYMKLAEAKEHLMGQTDEEEERQRALRRELLQRREEIFDRLYNSALNRNDNSRLTSQQSGRSRSSVASDAFFKRLYDDALESIAEKRERVRRAAVLREQEELEDAVRTRILAKLELEVSPRRVLTPQQKEARARSIQRELLDDPRRLQTYLQTNRLSRIEEERLAARLSKHGYTDAATLSKKKTQRELEGCTFRPRINQNYSTRRSLSSGSYTRPTALSTARSKRSEIEVAPSTVTPRRSSHVQKRACEQLYMRAVSQRAKAKVHAEEADRQKRLALLKSRLKEDHHFRRRVELDPLLAERFMNSLVV